MATRQILAQLNIVQVSSLIDSGSGFIGFGAKADGLYLKNGAAAELRLLTAGDVGVGVAAYGHSHSGFQATLSGTGLVKSTAGVISYDTNTYVTGTPWTALGYVSGTPWTGMGYLTSQSSHADVLVDGDFASQGIMLRGASSGVYSILSDNSANWNTAFVWGNHASAGYAPSGHTHSGTYEPVLGNPASNGYVLSSTSTGVRSWIATSSYSLPLAANGTRGGIQITGYVPAAGCLPVSLYNESPYISMTKPVVEYVLTGDITTHTHSAYAALGHTHSGVYEPVLGNPTASGYILSSTTGGVRSWIAMGGSYTLPVASSGSLGGIKVGSSGAGGASVDLQLSGGQIAYVNLNKIAVETALTGLITSHTHSYAPINGSSSNAFSTANLSVSGTISASSTITGSEVYRGSSRNLKKNVADFDFDAIGFLRDVDIKRYNLKSNGSFGIGFIAEQTHPWLSGDDQKSHVFGNHLGLLTKAIQEEDQKVEAMNLEVLELQARVKELEIARSNGWK